MIIFCVNFESHLDISLVLWRLKMPSLLFLRSYRSGDCLKPRSLLRPLLRSKDASDRNRSSPQPSERRGLFKGRFHGPGDERRRSWPSLLYRSRAFFLIVSTRLTSANSSRVIRGALSGTRLYNTQNEDKSETHTLLLKVIRKFFLKHN